MRRLLGNSLCALIVFVFSWFISAADPSSGDPKPSLEMAADVLDLTADLAKQLQCTYWTSSPAEKAALLGRYPDCLSGKEVLRLLHLCCVEMLDSKEGRARWLSEQGDDFEAPKGAAADLCQQLVRRLLSESSPYRPRHCAIWKGEAAPTEQRQPDLQGILCDASWTHLGCLEVIRLDDQYLPKELVFLPFDEVQGVVFGQAGLFRPAKIVYEYSKGEEIVCIPLQYGISWLTEYEYDHDGSYTRFCFQLFAEKLDRYMGLGVGHRDFILREQGAEDREVLLGLGSVGEIGFSLDLSDPRFDHKCQGRGLDPLTIKKQFSGK